MVVKNTITCGICKQKKTEQHSRVLETIRDEVKQLIRKEHPDLQETDIICRNDLRIYRERHVIDLLEKEKGELSKLDREVIKSMVDHEVLVRKIGHKEEKLTFGEKLADRVAEFGGSWKFITLYLVTIMGWIILNAIIFTNKGFDPYPFILLNLLLSCLAALQAPIILMSQNRQAAKDRIQTENDYKTDLKAELQIRHLNEKIDYLTQQQWRRLLEIQQMQLELLQEKASKKQHKEKVEKIKEL